MVASIGATSKPVSLIEAADALGTNRSAVQKARAIRTHAPELEADVKAGKLALDAAATTARKRGTRGKTARAYIDPPYMPLRVATPEETERPPAGASLEEVFAWRNRIGAKVPLFSMRAKELMEARLTTDEMITAIVRTANTCDAAKFRTAIDKMLAHEVDPDSTSGAQVDYAKDARSAMTRLRRDLETAIAKLLEFRGLIDEKPRAKLTLVPD
jgi:hypothetical protein